MSFNVLLTMDILLGGILLFYLCVKDYKENVIKPKNQFHYMVTLGLFIITNLAIYNTICIVSLEAAGAGVTFSNGLPQFSFPADGSFEVASLIMPFIVVFSYFGIGAGTFKVWSFEFRFYDWLIGIFQSLFKRIEIELKPPKETESGIDKYQLLENKVMQLQLEAGNMNNWDKMSKAWVEVQNDADILRKHIDDLSSIKENLSVRPIKEADLEGIKLKIEKKISNLWYSVNLMISRFVIQFIFKNIKDTERIEKELSEIGWLLPVRHEKTKPFSRLIGISLFSGIVLGIIVAFGKKSGSDPISLMWCGAISLIIFSLFISKIDKNQDIGKAIILGASGGFIGLFFWKFCREIQNMPEIISDKFFYNIVDLLHHMGYRKLIFGSVYGASIALILLIGHKYIRRNLSKYCLVSLSGGIIFAVIHIILKALPSEPQEILLLDILPKILLEILPEIFICLIAGVVVLSGLLFATDSIDDRSSP